MHTGLIKIDALTGLLFFSLSRNMPRVWWRDPRDSDFAKFLLVNAPPADPLYSAQVVCPASHQNVYAWVSIHRLTLLVAT